MLHPFQVSSPEQVIPYAVIHLDPDTVSIASQNTFSEEVGQEWGDLVGDCDNASSGIGRPLINSLEQLGGGAEIHRGDGQIGGRNHRERRWSPPTSIRSGEPASKSLRYIEGLKIHLNLLSFS